jgi:hypothetical protein
MIDINQCNNHYKSSYPNALPRHSLQQFFGTAHFEVASDRVDSEFEEAFVHMGGKGERINYDMIAYDIEVDAHNLQGIDVDKQSSLISRNLEGVLCRCDEIFIK